MYGAIWAHTLHETRAGFSNGSSQKSPTTNLPSADYTKHREGFVLKSVCESRITKENFLASRIFAVPVLRR
jgi:hypothetical protein